MIITKNTFKTYMDWEERVYLAVPYAAKDEAKSLGAAWDGDKKSWYGKPSDEELIAKFGIVKLKIPFDRKDEAKKLGAMWDPRGKCWYCARSNVALMQIYGTGAEGTETSTVTRTQVNSGAHAQRPRGPRVKPMPVTSGFGFGNIKAEQKSMPFPTNFHALSDDDDYEY